MIKVKIIQNNWNEFIFSLSLENCNNTNAHLQNFCYIKM